MLQVETVLKHLLTTVGRMFRRVAISFISVFLVAAAAVEAAGSFLTKQFPATGLTHVVAVVIGFSLALNVGLAVAIEEGLRGFIHLIQEVAKVTEEAAVKVARAAEHELGAVAHSAGHVVQDIERGAVTAARDVAHIPGQIIGGVEGGVQGIERRVTGQDRNNG